MSVSYEFDPGNKLGNAIKKALLEIEDLTVPFKEMTASWYKSNVSIFSESRKSAGKYQDLSPRYKSLKEKHIGSAYPILRGFLKPKGQPARKSGKLADSMLDPRNPDSISRIINKTSLILGTKVTSKGKPYGLYLHHGTNKMPARPFVLLGAEQVAPDPIRRRRQKWIDMIEDFVIQKSKGFAT